VLGIVGVDGVFARAVAMPLSTLHAVPDAVADEQAVFVEPLAAAFEILEQVELPARTEVTVLGDGKLGLLVAMVLAQASARVRLVGKHQAHLDIAQSFGVQGVLFDDWDRAPAELVVEATGKADGVGHAILATKPRGTIVLKSTLADPSTIDLASVVVHELKLVGSRCGPFAPALGALAQGRLNPSPLIAAREPLSRAPAALALAGRPGMLKVLLDCAAVAG